MPIKRLDKTRASLPPDYQYGDAGKPAIRIRFLKSFDIHVADEMQQKWRDDFHAPEGAQLGGAPNSCR